MQPDDRLSHFQAAEAEPEAEETPNITWSTNQQGDSAEPDADPDEDEE